VGWDIVWQDQHHDADGKELLRHVFFDMGDGNLMAFMCSRPNSPFFPDKWETDINTGLGMKVPGAYHFAFWADSLDDLEAKRQGLMSRGAETTAVMNHGWCKGFYFKDPVNGLTLEYCLTTRDFNDDDKLLKPRDQPGFEGVKDQEELERTARVMGISVETIPTV
tara:strand:+ start:6467 stop:6961 length:495 start_codon:yes stop_codon:yes gene_type:complete